MATGVHTSMYSSAVLIVLMLLPEQGVQGQSLPWEGSVCTGQQPGGFAAVCSLLHGSNSGNSPRNAHRGRQRRPDGDYRRLVATSGYWRPLCTPGGLQVVRGGAGASSYTRGRQTRPQGGVSPPEGPRALPDKPAQVQSDGQEQAPAQGG